MWQDQTTPAATRQLLQDARKALEEFDALVSTGMEGPYFQVDLVPEDPEGPNGEVVQTLWHDIMEALGAAGLECPEPCIEHDCVSGPLQRQTGD